MPTPPASCARGWAEKALIITLSPSPMLPGVRGMSGHVIISFLPPYLQRAFPTHTDLDATYATVVGVAATLSAVIIGIICEARPWARARQRHAAGPPLQRRRLLLQRRRRRPGTSPACLL